MTFVSNHELSDYTYYTGSTAYVQKSRPTLFFHSNLLLLKLRFVIPFSIPVRTQADSVSTPFIQQGLNIIYFVIIDAVVNCGKHHEALA